MEQDNTGRINSICYLRVLAMVFILLCHFNAENEHEIIRATAQFFNIGVQIFFVVSGFLAGKHLIQKISWRRWYFKRLKRIYIPYELFLIFLAIFTVRVGMSLLNINWLLLAFGLQGTNVGVLGAEQTWFISSLLICYLLTPAINGLYEQITNKYLFLIVVLVFPLVLLMLREVWAFTLLSPLSEYAIGIYLGKNNIENKLANKRLPMMMLLLVMAFSFRVAGRV